MTDISFEHFDPELELGNLDENGRPIRPRKKPGRKPNPPSPAQRKAQNRAAQRAFRERKRREMREAENTVKRCMYIRDQALKEVNMLRKRLDIYRYENNYLKGCLLTFKLACIANRVDVPKFWDTGMTDELGAERLTFSKTKGIPQSLEFFLNKHMNIVGMNQNDHPTSPVSADSPCSSSFEPTSPFSSTTTGTSTQESQLSSSPQSSYSANSADSFLSMADPPLAPKQDTLHDHPDPLLDLPSSLDMSQALSALAPQLASHLESPFFQHLLTTDLVSDLLSHMNRIDTPMNLSSSSSPSSAFDLSSFLSSDVRSMLSLGITNDKIPTLNDPSYDNVSLREASNEFGDPPSHESYLSALESAQDDGKEEFRDAKTGLARTTTEAQDEPISDPTHPKPSSCDKKVFPPMPSLDAVQHLRAMKNLDATTRALFTPTELQRTIPHDTRIDVVPGPAMRDHMILFQDFYDANELFDFLIDSAIFLGGELGNPDCWFVPPSFLSKYWFLCPNHKPERMDNAVEIMVELGQQMIKHMFQRKQMYIQREQYPDYFPNPATDASQSLCNNVRSLTFEDSLMTDEIPLGKMRTP
ncbi:uncharacterized protein BYT42DRAFT_559316 [Radiomyces spectabilis]|uniref:uncharacterized protein n=1 Tax=Radiomyces spectabilis TaxID=64574 RepID=UPI00221E6655|nr:uncharacterized protein BYT42DRAFT_559316 [Radiomyces spectabilis]KAI8388224.1 hypothetical protein BYT42DRAFT_559316 [Radiomyces spectabilis]